MKGLFFVLLLAIGTVPGIAQGDLERLIETERSFAARAAESGTRQAFLQYTAPDGLLFLPDRIKTTDYWNSRGESEGSLSWAPNYADIASNGIIGYTTGNWEFRPKGPNDTPSGFGQFITVWRRNPDGTYKFVVDMGISHPKPERFSADVAPPSYTAVPNSRRLSAADSANGFFEIAGRAGVGSAYKSYAAKEIRAYREGEFPILGRDGLIRYVKKRKGNIVFAKRSVFLESNDIAYITNTYSEVRPDGSVEKGNFLQIWKLIGDRWQIVLDAYKPVPSKDA